MTQQKQLLFQQQLRNPVFQLLPVRCISSYHFDTFKFVERLEAEGFSREQSEAIMASLREVISER